jgi:hypothetical protein
MTEITNQFMPPVSSSCFNVGKEKIMKVPLADESDESIDDGKSEHQWCLHCERAYKRGKHRLVDGLKLCPYKDCDGDTVMDGWPWPQVREGHPDYPEIPEKGKCYPLYS